MYIDMFHITVDIYDIDDSLENQSELRITKTQEVKCKRENLDTALRAIMNQEGWKVRDIEIINTYYPRKTRS